MHSHIHQPVMRGMMFNILIIARGALAQWVFSVYQWPPARQMNGRWWLNFLMVRL